MSYMSFIILYCIISYVNFSTGNQSVPYSANTYHSLSFTNEQLVKMAGYNYEFHETQTEDRYLIGLHRIVGRNSTIRKNGHPVLLVNGFCVRSRSWILRGKGVDFPFILAEKGYDVWLGDQRGNPYSDKHLNYSFHDYKYWNFSIHEIGSYDLPAMINKVLNVTSHKKLTYVGQSLGSSFYFTMLSERKEIIKNISSSIHFVPFVLPPDPRELTLLHRAMLKILPALFKLVRIINVKESHTAFVMKIVGWVVMNVCDRWPLRKLCFISLPWLVGGSMEHFDQEHLGYQIAASMSITSFKTCEHIMQIYSAGKFLKYDYGKEKNQIIYGKPEPAEYNVSKILSPTAMFIADRDEIVPYCASKKTIVALGKRKVCTFRMRGFNHIEMGLGLRARKRGYSKALKFLKKATLFSNANE